MMAPCGFSPRWTEAQLCFHYVGGFLNPYTRTVLGLHGSCYKTSSWKAFRTLGYPRECGNETLAEATISRNAYTNEHRQRTSLRGHTYSVENAKPRKQHCFTTLSVDWFQVIFTCFSAFFSSVLHSTCSLSVLWTYLDLSESHQTL
jgi:hypothetical protein